MKGLTGILVIATLITCGPMYLSVPVMAGEVASLTRTQDAEARRNEWIRLKWEKMMAQARAQHDQLERWRRAKLQRFHARAKKRVLPKQSRIAAELSR